MAKKKKEYDMGGSTTRTPLEEFKHRFPDHHELQVTKISLRFNPDALQFLLHYAEELIHYDNTDPNAKNDHVFLGDGIVIELY